MKKINLTEKLKLFTEHWSPKILAELNGQQVKIAKIKGEFVWHKHDHEDELFLILKGKLTIEFRDKIIELKEGEMLVIPKGIEHKPVAKEEVAILLFEPAGTVNTGNTDSGFTIEHPEWI
ncbi:MAG: cupin domain-containing protein [Crocinitomicaceae bacterium]